MTPTQLSIFGMNSYHNSLNEGDERKLTAYEETARNQNEKILAFMKARDGVDGWTSNELQEHFPNILLTSIRRALTDLSTRYDPPLVQVVGKREGTYGRNCLVYRAVTRNIN
jgi:hypothetical protein